MLQVSVGQQRWSYCRLRLQVYLNTPTHIHWDLYISVYISILMYLYIMPAHVSIYRRPQQFLVAFKKAETRFVHSPRQINRQNEQS